MSPCGCCFSSRRRAWSRTSKYGDGSGAVHVSSTFIVERRLSNSRSQAAHADMWAFTLSPGAAPESAASKISSFNSLHNIIVAFPGSKTLHKLFQALAQRFVSSEQERLRRRLAQLQDLADFLVIEPLIFMHQH